MYTTYVYICRRIDQQSTHGMKIYWTTKSYSFGRITKKETRPDQSKAKQSQEESKEKSIMSYIEHRLQIFIELQETRFTICSPILSVLQQFDIDHYITFLYFSPMLTCPSFPLFFTISQIQLSTIYMYLLSTIYSSVYAQAICIFHNISLTLLFTIYCTLFFTSPFHPHALS